MEREQQKRWEEFCELAAKERDPKRLIKFVTEINRLFEIERAEKRNKRPPSDTDIYLRNSPEQKRTA
jgi:hypothetical protein